MENKNDRPKYDFPESFIDSLLECVVELESLPAKLDAGALKKHYKVAREIVRLAPDEKSIREIEETTDADVVGWLLDLPRQLHRAGMTSEAVQHQRFWAGVIERANFLGDRVQLLGEAGMRDEAYEQIKELDREFPNDAWVQIKIGDALNDLHEFGEAEERWRRALTLSKDEYDNEGALERLVPLLEQQGRAGDARTIEKQIRDRAKRKNAAGTPNEEAGPPDKLQTSPVGRNDPCPCGSGKKYKKCHGA